MGVFVGGICPLRADPVISEFMASNTVTLADQDQAFSDWIEIHNPDGAPVNLAGWYLTDNAANKLRWQFPAVTLSPGGYLVVFASNKNRRDPAAELHTNFALAAEGEYLGLIRPDGVTVASEYAPTFPVQLNDISYGRLGAVAEAVYFPNPTPGAANNPSGTVALAATVRFSRPPGPFSAPFTLELAGAGPGQHIRFVAVPPSTAGSLAPEPTAASPRYAEPLAISGAMLVRAAVFSDDLKTRGLSGIAQYFPLALAGTNGLAGFSSRLPVLTIEQHGFGGLDKEDQVQPAWLFGFAAAAGATFGAAPEFVSPIFMNVRGSSSAVFPKKSYSIEIVNDQRKATARALFGSRPFEEWALVGPWRYDPSFIRNSLIYGLSNRIGRWAPRTQPVEVFLNANGFSLDATAYIGVYVLTDKVEMHPDRVAIARTPSNATGAAEITGGYLLKIDQPDADEFAWKTPHVLDSDSLSSIVVTSPKADRLSAAQRTYIRGYVLEMEEAMLADQASGWRTRTYLDYLDRSSWVDHHILNTFAANPDAFERSAYFHKPKDGKLVAGPVWDMDRAVGSYEDERSFRWDLWSGVGAVEPWTFGWWGILATDPEFMQEWIDRWQTLRRGALSDSNLTGLVDQLAADIGPAAAARDAARWVDDVSGFGGTYAGEITHIKGWLELRADWIDGQFVEPPSVTASAGSLVLTPITGAQIAFTLDGSDPRALGGGVAPNAVVVSDRVTVPLAANLHARSYRASAKGVFPGSPWSSAVGGADSSPLSPASRVVNLSSRAIVGTGEDALIMGVIVADSARKRYLARGIGPGLAAFGATGTVPDPQLSLFTAEAVEIARNTGWGSGADATSLPQLARNVGAFALAPGSADSALVTRIGAGAYSIQITTPRGQPGLGLAELYELDGAGRTLNISTRAQVGAGDQVLIGGFVVVGAAHKRMLIRAIGPTLRAFGVTRALGDPILTLYSGATAIATNDRWAATGENIVAAAGASVGAFPLDRTTEDAALLITLPPGAYTVELRGKSNGTGVALLEIYEVP
jgi:hypothetical protein